MDEEAIRILKEDFSLAQDLRGEVETIEKTIAERVQFEVDNFLKQGKKLKALEVIDKVYHEEDGGTERNTYWYQHFQKIIYEYK